MFSAIIPFIFEDAPVRTLLRDGEPIFSVPDLARACEIKNARDVLTRLDPDEVIKVYFDELRAASEASDPISDIGSLAVTVGQTDGHSPEGGARMMNFVTESGMWAIVLRSDKPRGRSRADPRLTAPGGGHARPHVVRQPLASGHTPGRS